MYRHEITYSVDFSINYICITPFQNYWRNFSGVVAIGLVGRVFVNGLGDLGSIPS